MNMMLVRFIMKATPVFILGLLIVKLVVINEFTGIGEKVQSLDTHLSQVLEENEVLTQRYASASSLLTIGAKAQEAQFHAPAKDQYLSISADQYPVAVLNLR